MYQRSKQHQRKWSWADATKLGWLNLWIWRMRMLFPPDPACYLCPSGKRRGLTFVTSFRHQLTSAAVFSLTSMPTAYQTPLAIVQQDVFDHLDLRLKALGLEASASDATLGLVCHPRRCILASDAAVNDSSSGGWLHGFHPADKIPHRCLLRCHNRSLSIA